MPYFRNTRIFLLSLPLWERGLKYFADGTEYMVDYVAPLVGAWIEIKVQSLVNRYLKSLPLWERGLKSGQILFNYEELSRSPCGSVD